MRKHAILVTGSAGEVGQALIKNLASKHSETIISLDLNFLPDNIAPSVYHIKGSILDEEILNRLISEYEITAIYHLAALLSTRAEYSPEAAHNVNVGGTMQLLQIAAEQSSWRSSPVKFIFPSSIAAFGMPDAETKVNYAKVREWEWNYPRTMYGCNKLYCELLGQYFSSYYRQLAADQPTTLDFRCVRFPGLISAFTMPSGGTSDYGPEMLHAAANNEPYKCFVREDVRIPFMVMPDAIKALIKIAEAPISSMQRKIYNVSSFSLSAAEFREEVLHHFPNAQITFEPDLKRQDIVDSWPADVDDSAARRDWGWEPDYDLRRSFDEYLVPNIRQRYE